MTFVLVALVLALVALFSLSAATRFRTPVPPQQLITSPQSCLTDAECPLERYCSPPEPDSSSFSYFLGFEQEASTCAPRLPRGSNCSKVGAAQCEPGTFCSFLDDFNPVPLTCLPQLPAGADCALSLSNPCQGDLVCEIQPKCRPFNPGVAGDFCQSDSHCQQQNGFYCRTNFNQCTAKRPPGAACGLEPENFECQGFCVGPAVPFDGKPGVCQRLQTAGEKCTEDSQCQTLVPFTHPSRVDDLLCNRPSARVGKCVLQSELLIKLGDACDPHFDKCDARRGLSCGRVRGRKFRCVQRAVSPDSIPYCTPHSPLSHCPPDSLGVPRECRRGLSLSKQFQGVFACRRRRERVPLGAACSSDESVICGRNAVCTEVPGVELPTGRRPPPPLHTCMKVLPTGARCKDPFRFTCEEGAFCVNGTCQNLEAPPAVPVTFTRVDEDCSELKCPPGTECRGDPEFPENGKFCSLPVLEVGLWRPCFATSRFQRKCKKDLHCGRDYKGRGRSVCRPKRRIGFICENDDSCMGDLKCDPSFRNMPFQRKCYDPALSLNLGDSCSPNPRSDEPRCVAQVDMGPISEFIQNFSPLSCLPKNGSNICQKGVGLFEQCSPEENIACESEELRCSEFNVCVPSSQL